MVGADHHVAGVLHLEAAGPGVSSPLPTLMPLVKPCASMIAPRLPRTVRSLLSMSTLSR